MVVTPAHTTKQKRTEHLPLSGQTMALLSSIREDGADLQYVFPGKAPGKPLTDIKKFWQGVLVEAGIEDARLHDLRHTHASHLVSSGMSLAIVGRLLGHTQAQTTHRYAHLADVPLRAAAEHFGAKADVLGGGEVKKSA
ncbi:MAG: site-specific integrase [Magnetospirillum sp.]|nr:site-specific integrase [Magnetospirillum sp.]